jgi:peptidoglycan/xylan/chitin deacetylase (PgdA/CDA1 family)
MIPSVLAGGIAMRPDLDALTRVAHAYDRRHQPIRDLIWPDGARIAVNFTADFDAMLLRRLLNEPPMQLAKGEFGGRVGVWRLIALFDSHHIKATFFTPGRIRELYPEALRAAHASGHELADHMWEHHVPRDAQLEMDHLRKTGAALRDITGRDPVGSRSDHSLSLLRELGFLYVSHDSADHLPYFISDADGANTMLNLPFHYAIDDAMFYSFAWLGSENAAQRITDTDRVMEMWWQAFLQQYHEGGYLNICLHPFVSGRAQRIDMLDTLIGRMKRLPGVWFPSCEQVARWCLANHKPA